MISNLIHNTTQIIGVSGQPSSVQYPLQVDGDSVHADDVWIEFSDINTFEGGVVTDLFDNLHSVLTASGTENPKELFIHFERTIPTTVIGIGAHGVGANFSNIKITGLVSGPIEFTLVDESTNDTKYTSRQFDISSVGFNAMRIQFHTSDPVSISNLFILKTISTLSRIQIQKPDSDFVEAQGTQSGNFKMSLEELENQVSVNNNSQLRTTPFASTGQEYTIDLSTGDYVTITQEHHEIHEGDHYNYCDYSLDEDSGNTLEFIFTTPDTTKWTHLTLQASSSEGATVELYEGTTGVVGGTTIIPRNNNRNSANLSGITLIKDPTSIANDGTRAAGFLAGGDKTAGFFDRDNENILKQNETYLVRVTSLAASNDISWCAEWYDHVTYSG